MGLEDLGDDDIALGPHLEAKTCDLFRLKTIIRLTSTRQVGVTLHKSRRGDEEINVISLTNLILLSLMAFLISMVSSLCRILPLFAWCKILKSIVVSFFSEVLGETGCAVFFPNGSSMFIHSILEIVFINVR